MFHYEKNKKDDLEIIVGGRDIRMFYRVMSGTGLLERRDMYEFKTYIEENFRQELGLSNPVSAGPTNDGKEVGNGNEQAVQG